MSRSARLARSLAAVTLAAIAAHAAEPEPRCGGGTDPEVSIKACTRLIEFGSLDRPQLARAYYTRGSEFASQGNHERAIVDFNMAIELDPQVAVHFFNRALSFSERGEHESAIADYDRALKLAPGEVRTLIGRAVEWTFIGDYKRAEADYDEIIRRAPTNIAGYFGRGRVRLYAGQYLPAASDFTRAHQLEPGIYTALWLFLARKRADIPAEQTLVQDSGASGSGGWPEPVIALYLGKMPPQAVQKAATSLDVKRQRDQRCEANFYIGEWHLLRGERGAASQLLAAARAGCPSTFIEHEGAVAELRQLQQKP